MPSSSSKLGNGNISNPLTGEWSFFSNCHRNIEIRPLVRISKKNSTIYKNC